MELQHINVKLYLENPQAEKLGGVVPVFHEWIQNKVCAELLIDVADYRHVHAGPGVVLVGHEADYSVDNTDNRLGIRYNRKAALEGTNWDRFSQAMRSALLACRRLESDEKLERALRFDRRNLKLFVNDRLLAPNASRAHDSVRKEFQDFLAAAVGDYDFAMEFETDPRSLFGVEVKVGKPLEVDRVLARLT